jgi:hypothetical protein
LSTIYEPGVVNLFTALSIETPYNAVKIRLARMPCVSHAIQCIKKAKKANLPVVIACSDDPMTPENGLLRILLFSICFGVTKYKHACNPILQFYQGKLLSPILQWARLRASSWLEDSALESSFANTIASLKYRKKLHQSLSQDPSLECK